MDNVADSYTCRLKRICNKGPQHAQQDEKQNYNNEKSKYLLYALYHRTSFPWRDLIVNLRNHLTDEVHVRDLVRLACTCVADTAHGALARRLGADLNHAV